MAKTFEKASSDDVMMARLLVLFEHEEWRERNRRSFDRLNLS